MQLPSFWPPWGTPPPFRPQDLEYDVERLKNFYRRQGFLHTQIKPEISYGPGGAVDVTLKIDEGPWVKVTDIDVEVAGLIDLSELKSKWPLNPGDRFAEKPYDDLKNLYLNYLPDHGYPKVKVKGRVFLNEETNTAKILLSVNPGPVCYFGKVTIKDAEQLETPEAAILSKLTFKTGQLFNQERLFDTQRKLYATDLFRSVILTPEQVPPQEPSIPIVVELAEKKKRSLKAGLGYGNEEKIRARLGLRYRNLWGAAGSWTWMPDIPPWATCSRNHFPIRWCSAPPLTSCSRAAPGAGTCRASTTTPFSPSPGWNGTFPGACGSTSDMAWNSPAPSTCRWKP